MKINFVNADHVHALVDLPTGISIEEMVQLFKGSSSHWINQSDLLKTKFAWGRGYGIFRFLIQELMKSQDTSPDRKSIIRKGATQKNCSDSWSVTASNGATSKPLKRFD
jgi:REP element-mobilizing transposase RayT